MTKFTAQIAHAESLIANALLEYTPKNLVLSYNGGKDCTVLLALLDKVLKRFPEFKNEKIKTVYVAEKDSFEEVEGFIDESVLKYPFIDLYRYNLSLKESFLKFSEDLNIKNYAILIGVRKTDPYCDNLQEVHASDNGWPKFIRINPILNWDYSDIWKYLDDYNIPYCILYKKGYTSLGSVSKTLPNPKLKNDNENGYLHARFLLDSKFERLGRI